jgi:hypothetical protein
MMGDVTKEWDGEGESDVRSDDGEGSTIGTAMCLWDQRRRRASPTEATICLMRPATSHDDPEDSDESDAVDHLDDNEVALECPEGSDDSVEDGSDPDSESSESEVGLAALD